VPSAISEVSFLDPNDYDDSDRTPVTGRISTVLSFVTQSNKPLEVFQLPRVADEVSASVIAQSALLVEILSSQPNSKLASAQDFMSWYQRISRTYDLEQEVELEPVDPSEYRQVSSTDEARELGVKFIQPDLN